MGTRNLTCVFFEGAFRIAQYCQWDGYPEGVGCDCLRFLHDLMNETVFKEKLHDLRWITQNEYNNLINKFKRTHNTNKFVSYFPEFCSDTGPEILLMVQDGNTCGKLLNSIKFAADSLFCEWAYVIDLDKRTFEIYKGFNKEPLTPADRFFCLKDHEKGNYHGVKMSTWWDLDILPTKEAFLDWFDEHEVKDECNE